ncbi:MAG TPA: branched-chain amino acid ABC transporter permease [Gaiellaceae bacterium]|jgi:branched-chain amino acid transport system permease protein|nr:branched-chain amino acid ABC transporter permease [Gaiellaceae bacterium]
MTIERRKQVVERALGIAVVAFVLAGPYLVSGFWMDTVLTQTFILGIGAASLVFLSAYGGMISLAQAGLMGIAGYALGNMVTERVEGGETKGLLLGWNPTLSVLLAILLTVAIGLVFGAVASRSFGIYFLMLTLTYSVIAFLFVSQVTQVGGFSPIAGIDRYTPGFVGDVVNDRERLYYISFGVAVVVYVAIRYLVRSPFGIALEGIRDEPVRMGSLGFNVTLHRTLAFTFGSLIAGLAGVLFAWWSGQLSPSDIGLQATIQLLVIAVIGGLRRIEGAWVGAFAYIWISNEVTNRIPEGGLWLIGGSFNTVIGFAFLAIVIISPDGLMGVWDRIWNGVRGRGGTEGPAVAPGSAGSQA